MDYGSKTVGVAMTDALNMTASPFETIVRKEENKLRRTFARIEEIIRQYDVGTIVLGNPVHMDGSASERSKETDLFREKLEKRTGLEVISWDERLTTVEAEEVLKEMEIPKAEWKQYVDRVAACLILEDYLKQKTKEK